MQKKQLKNFRLKLNPKTNPKKASNSSKLYKIGSNITETKLKGLISLKVYHN